MDGQTEVAGARAALGCFIAAISVACPFCRASDHPRAGKASKRLFDRNRAFFAGAVTFIAAEVLKLTVVERLFQLNKEKLLSIPAFAWGYRHWRAMMNMVESLAVWKAARKLAV